MAERKTKPSEITNEQWADAIKKLDEMYLVIVIGDPKENKPGVLERLRIVEGFISFQRKAFYAVAGALVLDIALRFWNLVAPVVAQAAGKQ